MSEDGLDDIIERKEVVDRIRSKIRKWSAPIVEVPSETSALEEAINEQGSEIGHTRRSVIHQACRSLLGLVTSLNVDQRIAAIAAVAGMTAIEPAIEGAYYAKLSYKKSLSDDVTKMWGLDPLIAFKIGGLVYNDPKVNSISGESNFNLGAKAIVDSFLSYKYGDYYRLNILRTNILKAIECSIEEISKQVAMSRLLVIENMLANGREARSLSNTINPKLFSDKKITANILDFQASIMFNSCEATKFGFFTDRNIEKIINEWKHIGVDVFDYTQDKNYIKEYSMHIFSMQQLRHFFKCQSLEGSSRTKIELREYRKQIIRDHIEATKKASGAERPEIIYEDFFGSLQRPAFHALLSGDWDHLKEIVSIYFEDQSGKRVDALHSIRVNLSHGYGGNQQWMSLLRIAVLAREKKSDAQHAFEEFIRRWNIASDEPYTKNVALLKALPYLARNIGLNSTQLIENSPAIRHARIPEITLQMAYSDGLCAMTKPI